MEIGKRKKLSIETLTPCPHLGFARGRHVLRPALVDALVDDVRVEHVADDADAHLLDRLEQLRHRRARAEATEATPKPPKPQVALGLKPYRSFIADVRLGALRLRWLAMAHPLAEFLDRPVDSPPSAARPALHRLDAFL